MKKGDFRIFHGYITRFEGKRKRETEYLNTLRILYYSGELVTGYYYGYGEPLTLKFVLNNEYVSLCKDKAFIKDLLTFLTRSNLT